MLWHDYNWNLYLHVGVTCQRSNGKCDQVCSDTVIGVNCSCYNGYQLIDNHNCSGK